MWLWYKAFASFLGAANFLTWTLAVMFLVFTLRAILYNPFVRQIRTTRQMQELQPQIKALQKKYGKDRQRMALEMQKLQREHGFNPILGCLPMLAQIPVFIGLYHVLRSFNRTTGGFGQPHLSVIAVGGPVMILAGIATYFNSRASVARQSPEAAANPQTAMMNKLALYVFPLGVVVGGPFLPIAIIMYWFANNIWTFGQQHYVFGMIEKEDEAKRQEAIQRRAANAPAPGSKPKRNPKTTPAGGNGSSTAGDEDEAAMDSAGADGDAADAKTGKAQQEDPNAAGRNNAPANRTPRPGARPKKRKR